MWVVTLSGKGFGSDYFYGIAQEQKERGYRTGDPHRLTRRQTWTAAHGNYPMRLYWVSRKKMGCRYPMTRKATKPAEPVVYTCFDTWIALDDTQRVDAREISGLSGGDEGTDVYLRSGIVLWTRTPLLEIECRMGAALGGGAP